MLRLSKRFLILMLTLLATATFIISCGSNNDNSSKVNDTNITNNSSNNSTVKPVDTVLYNNQVHSILIKVSGLMNSNFSTQSVYRCIDINVNSSLDATGLADLKNEIKSFMSDIYKYSAQRLLGGGDFDGSDPIVVYESNSKCSDSYDSAAANTTDHNLVKVNALDLNLNTSAISSKHTEIASLAITESAYDEKDASGHSQIDEIVYNMNNFGIYVCGKSRESDAHNNIDILPCLPAGKTINDYLKPSVVKQ